MYLHLIIIPAVFICDPGLGAAQLKVPVCHLAAHLLHAGCYFMLYIVRAVHQKITAAARAKADAEVVLTGREPAAWMQDAADYSTEMRAVKHPFARGVTAREGVEY